LVSKELGLAAPVNRRNPLYSINLRAVFCGGEEAIRADTKEKPTTSVPVVGYVLGWIKI